MAGNLQRLSLKCLYPAAQKVMVQAVQQKWLPHHAGDLQRTVEDFPSGLVQHHLCCNKSIATCTYQP